MRKRKENAERNINNEKNKANSAQIDKIHFEHELNEEVIRQREEISEQIKALNFVYSYKINRTQLDIIP